LPVDKPGDSLSYYYDIDYVRVVVPEPSRWLLLAAGLGFLMVLHPVHRRG